MKYAIRTLPFFCVVIICSFVLFGCSTFDRLGAAEHSLDRAGEKVRVKLLTLTDLQEYPDRAKWSDDDRRRICFGARLEEVFPEDPDESVPVIAAIAPVVAASVIDAVKTELDRQASLYEAQFIGAEHASSFWSGVKTYEGGKPKEWAVRHAGFELVRWTNEFPEEESEPAFRLVVAFKPSADDSRFFTVVPLFLQVQGAKAKIDQGSGAMTIATNIAIDAIWFDQGLRAHEARVASIMWSFSGYSLAQHTPLFFFDADQPGSRPYIAGWFAAPPLSYIDNDRDGKPESSADAGTPFKLTVAVTERDESKARAYIERFSQLIIEQRPTLIEAVSGAVGVDE